MPSRETIQVTPNSTIKGSPPPQAVSKTKSRFIGDPEHTLYLIDVSSFIFRAYFAIRSLSNKKGEPTNAVYGVATMLAKLVEDARPQYLAVVYDSKSGTSLRKEIYADYKANRSAPPDDLIPQFARIEQLITGFRMHSFRQDGMEADDLIATLAKRWREASPKNHVVIVSGDKDLLQLVDGTTVAWDTMKDKVYGPAEVEEKLGIPPECVRDYLALLGDSSDNIPGVPGVGEKTAVELLKTFGSLDKILDAAEKGEIKGKRGETIKASREVAYLSAKLASLHDDLPVKVDKEDFEYRFQLTPEGLDLLRELDFHTLVAKWSGNVVSGLTSDLPRDKSGTASPSSHQPALVTPDEPAAASSAPARASAASAPSTSAGYESAPAARSHNAPGDLTRLAQDPRTFRAIQTEAQLTEVIAGIEKAREFGFDLETTSLNPRQAEIVGVAVCFDPQFGCYIPVGHRASLTAPEPEQLPLKLVLEKLKPYLEDARYKKIGQNLKYDWSVLYQHGIRPTGIGADTMVAAYVIDPNGRHNLDTLAMQYLDYKVMTFEEVCGKGKDQLGFDQIPVDVATRYSAEDAWISIRLWQELKRRIEAEHLMPILATVDLPLVEVLARMECEGVCLDVSWLKKLSTEFSAELKTIEERIGAYTKGPVNLNSTKQLAQLLFEELKLPAQGKTKTGYSTDATVLEALAPLHEVPRLLLEYREITKLRGTYVDPLPELRDPKDGKIHATFTQVVAATGRLSSSDPNLQNIPIKTERGRRIRRAFVPSEGNVLVAADYSQIELRLLAHMSGDPELVRSFNADEDVHRRTASEIFGIPPEQVDDRQRGIAKAINFGLMYGKSAFALAAELGISRREAQETITKYFARYNGVKRYLDQSILDAKEKGYAVTLLGRKRPLPDINARNPAVRSGAERMAMNTPIQGTAADLMKLAMIEIDRRLSEDGFKAKLTIQVHDEVVLDCPKDEVERVQRMITEVMEGAMKLDVPLKVNAASGDNWMDV
jgi:DNA polymerase-1